MVIAPVYTPVPLVPANVLILIASVLVLSYLILKPELIPASTTAVFVKPVPRAKVTPVLLVLPILPGVNENATFIAEGGPEKLTALASVIVPLDLVKLKADEVMVAVALLEFEAI